MNPAEGAKENKMNKVPVVLTASSNEFEERVMIALQTLDQIIVLRPDQYIKVSGRKKGQCDFGEHYVEVSSLKDFFIVQSPRNKKEAY